MLIKRIFDNRGKIFMPKECDTELWKPIGERLHHVRMEKSLKPKESMDNFLVRHGLRARASWPDWEKGKKWPDVQTLIEICLKVDISPTWLLFGVGSASLKSVEKR